MASSLVTPLDAVSLYIHWPFCQSICPYCDFNRYLRQGPNSISDQDILQAYRADLSAWINALGKRRLKTIFIGGGTPSLMSLSLITSLLAFVSEIFDQNLSDIEVTMEMNPSSISLSHLLGVRDAGINRLSMGIQSFDDQVLKFLGREHSGQTARQALKLIQSVFPRNSFDLIYAYPGHTLSAWERTLKEALEIGQDHMSFYQLTFEPGTPFYQRLQQGDITPLSDDVAADLYLLTTEVMTSHGWKAYEVSNYARSPSSFCQHNLVYWRYEDYIGIGPGAHSRFTTASPAPSVSSPFEKWAYAHHKPLAAWLSDVQDAPCWIHRKQRLCLQTQAKETLLMGLRLWEGVCLHSLAKAAPLHPTFLKKLEHLKESDLLTCQGTRIIPSPEGLLRLDSLLAYLFQGPILQEESL